MTGGSQAAKLAATLTGRPATMRAEGQSETGRILSVGVRGGGDVWGRGAEIDRQWRDLACTARPELAGASLEFQRFLALLTTAGVEVLCLPRDETVGLDSLYARDASIVCDAGVILCNMGKPQRRTEPAAQEATLRRAGVPICGRITGDGRLEGGDVCWVDGRTLAVGRGYRTNDAGIRQVRDLLTGDVDEVIVGALPHWHGPEV